MALQPAMTNPNLTIPNVLTLARFAMVPAFITAYVRGRSDWALALFLVAGLTDGLDGLLARVLGQRSLLGAIMDPLADKLLLDSAYVCLSLFGVLPNWLGVLVVSRDVFIIGGMGLLMLFGVDLKGSVRPSLLSKANTLSQMVLALLALGEAAGQVGPLGPVGEGLVLLVAATTSLSGLQYLRRGFSLLPP